MRRSRAERGFSVALGLFAVVLAAYLFLSSAFFRLEKLSLSGSTHYSEADVMAIAGLHMGQNLFDINIRQVVDSLQADARIAQAVVRRQLPAGLSIALKERTAVAVLSTNATLWRIDGDGRVIEEVKGPHSHVVVTVQASLPNLIPGEVVDNRGVTAAASVAAALPVELAARISDIRAYTPENLELETRDGMKIRFGAWRDVPEKVRVLSSLLKQMQSRGSQAYLVDVSVPTSPVVQ